MPDGYDVVMKAVTWQGKRDVRVDTVSDPEIQEPTDARVIPCRREPRPS